VVGADDGAFRRDEGQSVDGRDLGPGRGRHLNVDVRVRIWRKIRKPVSQRLLCMCMGTSIRLYIGRYLFGSSFVERQNVDILIVYIVSKMIEMIKRW
jgi:hypothetical protein